MDTPRVDPESPLEAIYAAERALRERVDAARKEGEARVAAARQEALRRVADARCKVEESEDAAHEAAVAQAEAEGRRIRDEAQEAARAVLVQAEPRIGPLVARAVAMIVGEEPC